MKKLDVTFTFSGATNKAYNLPCADKRELNVVWRAGLDALRFMTYFSDVESVMDLGQGPSVDGRQELVLDVAVIQDGKKTDEYHSERFTWPNMDQQQAAIMVASFENQFLLAGVKRL